MCGILAIIGKQDSCLAKEVLAKLAHRGKNGTKIIHTQDLTLGFNRLAINDKSQKGMQPFEFKNLIGVFNAEIYNVSELKSKYQITLISEADTEIILPLFDKLGKEIIHVLDGFYVGIIYNKSTKKLFTIRDYIGKKPLFYAKTANFSFLCSELKAIEGLLNFAYIPKGFSQINQKACKLITKHKFQNTEEKIAKDVFIQAVKKRLPKNNEKIVVFLSGGLDSSIIASIVSKITNNVTYYVLGTEQNQDFKFVKILSKHLGIEKQIKSIPLPKKEELEALITQVVFFTESYNPSIISNGLATYLLSKSVRDEGINIVLSGEGADELFCGYKMSLKNEQIYTQSKILTQNMHFTELRRLDMASMAHTIEIRCPFLDKKVYTMALNCKMEDLFSDTKVQGKKILRDLFSVDLPSEITNREKVSFDVGSGIRELVVSHLSASNKNERQRLKEIWLNFFPKELVNHQYFHAYPVFDEMIDKRGIKHKNTSK